METQTINLKHSNLDLSKQKKNLENLIPQLKNYRTNILENMNNIPTIASNSNQEKPESIEGFSALNVQRFNSFKTTYSLQETFDLLHSEYSTKDIIECELKDIHIDNEGNFVVGGTAYKFSEQGLKSFCKILKVPYSFAKTIPAFAFQSILTDICGLYNKPIKIVVKNNSNLILNIVNGKDKHQDYLSLIEEYLVEIGNNRSVTFSSAQISDIGFRINYIFSDSNEQIIINPVDKDFYILGKSIIGDIYRIKNTLNIETLLIHESDDSFCTVGNYIMRKHGNNNEFDCKKLKINSEKAIEGDSKKGKQSFIDDFKESFLTPVSSNASNLSDIIKFSYKQNISIWTFLGIRSKLSKAFESPEAVDAFLDVDKDTIDSIKSKKEDLKSTVQLSELDKKLKQTTTNFNAKILFDLLINYNSGTELYEYEIVNKIAINILVDTYNHFNQ